MEALPLGVVVIGREGRVRQANLRAHELLGVTRGQLHGRRIDDLGLRVCDDDGAEDPGFVWPLEAALAGPGALPPFTIGLCRPGLERRWVEVTLAPVPVEGPYDGPFAVLTLADVGARRAEQASLRAREEHYRLLVENQGDALMRLSPEGALLDTSPAADRLLGARGGRADDLFALVHPEDRAAARAGHLRCLSGGQDVVWRFRLRRADGRRVWVEAVGNPVRDDNGHVREVQVSARDVTARVERERDADALHRVAGIVAGGADVDEVFAALTRELGEGVEADAVTLVRFGGRGPQVRGHWDRRDLPPAAADLAAGGVVEAVRRSGAAAAAPRAAGSRGRGAVVAVPVRVGGVQWGCLVAGCGRGGTRAACQDRLTRFAELASLAVTAAEERGRLRRRATLDPATGLLATRDFLARLEAETGRARRHDRPLSLVLVDVPGGAGGGDLSRAAAALTATVRAEDVAGRAGDRRLGWVLPETGPDSADRAAGRLRAAGGEGACGTLRTAVVTRRAGEDAAALFARAADLLDRVGRPLP